MKIIIDGAIGEEDLVLFARFLREMWRHRPDKLFVYIESGAIFYMFSGALLGILSRWNKKILFFIMGAGLILIVIGGIVLGVDNIAGDLKWYEYLYQF